ncbi:PorV/PorQ family protein [Candidatus Desantisbacteria bacterium]|nr:PorV/PorQ family protein [Candidatus Desantisbacteria bacterium]
MVKKVLSGLICASVIVVGSIYCDAGGKGTSAENFLKLGVGARAIGMGEAFTAVAADANAIYWNPAGLSNLDRRQINVMHNTWLVETYYDHISFAAPFKKGGMCAGITYLGTGDIPGFTDAGASTTNFTAYDMAVIGGYGWKPTDELSVGVSGKLLQSKIESHDANGVAIDIGVLSKAPVENLTVGGTIQNIGSTIKFNKDGDPLPLMVKVGAAYTMLDNNLITALDITKARDNDAKFNLGCEYLIGKSFAVRGGYNSKIDEGDGITIGIGYKHPVVTVDYAYVPWGDLAENDTHRVSLLFNLW